MREVRQKLAAKLRGQGADGKEEVRLLARQPAPTVRRQAPAGDDAVQVNVLVQLLPPGVQHRRDAQLGTKIEITNSDSILHNVHGLQTTDQGLQTIFNIAQPVRGQRTTVEPALTRPGIIHLACEAGHAWMNAYIFVAAHPYVTLTNQAGEFVMPSVPAGTYRIKMWHEGVIRKRNIESLQRYEYEDPYELTQEVVVQPKAESVVNFDLALRSN